MNMIIKYLSTYDNNDKTRPTLNADKPSATLDP